MIKVTNTGPASDRSVGGQGNVVYAKVADACPGCSETHLGLSWGAWNALTNSHSGSVVDTHW